MKIIVLLCAIVAFASAKPQIFSRLDVSPLAYSYPLVYVYNPGAPLNPDGTVADTPEVRAAKIAHFASFNAALSRSKRSAPLNPDGTVADTPEVAYAKIAHLSAVAKADGVVPYVYAPQWYAGVIRATPEVHVHEIDHSAAYNAANILNFAAYRDANLFNLAAHNAANAYHFAAHDAVLSRLKRLAPLNPDGTVSDTPERKTEHFDAHSEASA